VPDKEVERLTEQDATIASHMNEKRIVAPLDFLKPGLQILDSGTANGVWLQSLQPSIAEPHSLCGFNIMASFFPA
jgi:hypothetical protein